MFCVDLSRWRVGLAVRILHCFFHCDYGAWLFKPILSPASVCLSVLLGRKFCYFAPMGCASPQCMRLSGAWSNLCLCARSYLLLWCCMTSSVDLRCLSWQTQQRLRYFGVVFILFHSPPVFVHLGRFFQPCVARLNYINTWSVVWSMFLFS